MALVAATYLTPPADWRGWTAAAATGALMAGAGIAVRQQLRSAAQSADARTAELAGLTARIDELERALTAAQQSAESATQLAENAERTKRQFLANMSHEIRTPMNGVLGMLELAMDTELSGPQREYSETALSSAKSLLDIIDDILDFSKIEAGRFDLSPGDFDLRPRLTDVIGTLARRGEEKGLTVELEVAAAVPERIRGDFGRIRQVIVNLLGNAIKFTHKGQVKLRVTVDEQTESSVVLHFAVRDTGIGIAAEKRKAIFEAFRQADNSTTRQFGGVGLGLTISAALVERMGGEIWAESVPGRGSTFHFTARLAPAATSADGRVAPSSAVPRPPVQARRNGGLRVLLAEDNAVNQKLARSLLEREGHTVVIASNGRQAVDLFKESQFGLVLMDVQMPILGGIDAVKAIRELEQHTGGHVPIVAVTAHAMAGDREMCLAAGMDGYLSKPVRADELFAAISTLADTKTTANEDVRAENDVLDEVFDETELLNTVQGDHALLLELGAIFLEDAPAHMIAMRDAIASGDATALRFAAHTLKGSAATLTARRVASGALVLESMGKAGDLSGAAAAFANLETAMEELRVRLTPGQGR
jgi:signal transduction histidine kinase/CheY-like chemotaxis protein/HPt (histidine-containing phosphotransfer) domain-containing protein